MNFAAKRVQHYLLESNPFKTVESLSKLVDSNLYLTQNKDLAVLNKPPGFVLSNKNKDDKNFINLIKENIKKKFNWNSVLRIPIVTDDQSGIYMFASNKHTFDLTRKTMIDMFPSQHISFLKFYAISTFIPAKKTGMEVINVNYENIHNDLLYFDAVNTSKNALKTNRVLSFQIEHEVLDYNKDLNVALLRFNTGWHQGDGILFYSAKHLFPILGDHRYSSRVKQVLGKPALVPKPKEHKPETQYMNPFLLKCLGINEYLRDIVPLHLHLYEINLEKKFKKQKIILKQDVPLPDYFNQTLNNLGLKIPQEN